MASIHVLVDVDDVDDVFAGGGSPVQVHLSSRLGHVPQNQQHGNTMLNTTQQHNEKETSGLRRGGGVPPQR